MHEYLLGREEADLAAIIAGEVATLGVTGPFLDIGCGTGLWPALVHEAGHEAHGADTSPELIREARRRHPGPEYQVMDGARLAYPAATFIWVQLGEVLEHVDLASGGALLAEAGRVLRPGGRLRVTTPNRLKYMIPGRHPLRALGGLAGRSPDPNHRHEYWPWQLRRSLIAAGFRVDGLRFIAPSRWRLPSLSAGLEALATRL